MSFALSRLGAAPPTAAAGDGFQAPGPADFNLPPLGPDNTFEFLGQTMYLGVTKPMLQLFIAALAVFLFFYYAAKQRAMVPGRLQYVGEAGYGFVRNGLGRDIIGSHDFARFVPYLFALFFFILVNNLMASVPGFQYPTFSRSGMAYGLAFLSWVVYNAVGIKRFGLGGYLRNSTIPAGTSGPILLLLIPLEFFSNIIVRPITLSLRLFANMFAGHLLLILFALGGEYLLLHGVGLVKAAAPLAWLMFIAVSFLELLIQFLQAYVFVLLTAMYISSALSEEH